MNMKWMFLVAAVTVLTGCATSRATRTPSNFSQPTMAGMKSPSQVAACCRPLAEGRISLDKCMANPACIANGNRCCMNAF